MLFATDIDTNSIIPVGTVTAMLVAIFVAFMRRSSQQDDRVDKAQNNQIEGLKQDRNLWKKEADEWEKKYHQKEAEAQNLFQENTLLKLQLNQANNQKEQR